jgi:hypothetical protein
LRFAILSCILKPKIIKEIIMATAVKVSDELFEKAKIKAGQGTPYVFGEGE